MTDIRPFKEVKKESGENVISRLKEILEMAENGLINNVVVVGTTTDGELISAISNSNNPFLIIGHLEATKHRFIHGCIE